MNIPYHTTTNRNKPHKSLDHDEEGDYRRDDSYENSELSMTREHEEIINGSLQHVNKRFDRMQQDANNMYNMHNNSHVQSQMNQIQLRQQQLENEKREQLKEDTRDYLKKHTRTGTGIKGRDHPLYKTTNSQYGAKEASQLHKSNQYHGQNGFFTKEFVGGMYRNHSLNTNRTRNSTLKDPSFGSNEIFEHGI